MADMLLVRSAGAKTVQQERYRASFYTDDVVVFLHPTNSLISCWKCLDMLLVSIPIWPGVQSFLFSSPYISETLPCELKDPCTYFGFPLTIRKITKAKLHPLCLWTGLVFSYSQGDKVPDKITSQVVKLGLWTGPVFSYSQGGSRCYTNLSNDCRLVFSYCQGGIHFYTKVYNDCTGFAIVGD